MARLQKACSYISGQSLQFNVVILSIIMFANAGFFDAQAEDSWKHGNGNETAADLGLGSSKVEVVTLSICLGLGRV